MKGSAQNSSPVQSNVFLFENAFVYIRFRLPSTLIRSKTEHRCMKKGRFWKTLSRVEVFENGGFRPFSLLRLRRDILCFQSY